MMLRDDPRAIAESACAHISKVGGIPRSWLKYYVQYDHQRDENMMRIDCMEVVFSTRYGARAELSQLLEHLAPEVQAFLMLLWGEPCCHSN